MEKTKNVLRDNFIINYKSELENNKYIKENLPNKVFIPYKEDEIRKNLYNYFCYEEKEYLEFLENAKALGYDNPKDIERWILEETDYKWILEDYEDTRFNEFFIGKLVNIDYLEKIKKSIKGVYEFNRIEAEPYISYDEGLVKHIKRIKSEFIQKVNNPINKLVYEERGELIKEINRLKILILGDNIKNQKKYSEMKDQLIKKERIV